jgi:hypothetical protein
MGRDSCGIACGLMHGKSPFNINGSEPFLKVKKAGSLI